jgi:hypothetical protein
MSQADIFIIIAGIVGLGLLIPMCIGISHFYKAFSSLMAIRTLTRKINELSSKLDVRVKGTKDTKEYKENIQLMNIRVQFAVRFFSSFFAVFATIPIFLVLNFVVGLVAFHEDNKLFFTNYEFLKAQFAGYFGIQTIFAFITSCTLASLIIKFGYAQKSYRALKTNARIKMPSALIGLMLGNLSFYFFYISAKHFGLAIVPSMFFVSISLAVLTQKWWYGLTFFKPIHQFFVSLAKEKIFSSVFIKEIMQSKEAIVLASKIYGPTVDQKFQETLDKEKMTYD